MTLTWRDALFGAGIVVLVALAMVCFIIAAGPAFTPAPEPAPAPAPAQEVIRA